MRKHQATIKANLRQEAQHHECTLRLDGCQTSPCLLAHFRVIDVSGMSMKSPDLVAAISCFNCHELIDSRQGRLTEQEINAAWALAMARTIKIWSLEGFL